VGSIVTLLGTMPLQSAQLGRLCIECSTETQRREGHRQPVGCSRHRRLRGIVVAFGIAAAVLIAFSIYDGDIRLKPGKD
jgi:hypothetical protein